MILLFKLLLHLGEDHVVLQDNQLKLLVVFARSEEWLHNTLIKVVS